MSGSLRSGRQGRRRSRSRSGSRGGVGGGGGGGVGGGGGGGGGGGSGICAVLRRKRFCSRFGGFLLFFFWVPGGRGGE